MKNLKPTNRRCLCSACEEGFNSVGAFEKHRAGSHKKDTRRCLDADEMKAKGMSENKAGYWVTSLRPENEVWD